MTADLERCEWVPGQLPLLEVGEPCPVYSHGSDGWHCAVEGQHEQHRNAAGDVTW